MDYQNLLLDEQGGVLTVTVNRPQARNALSHATLTELRHLLSNLDGPRAVLLTGSEGPAFIAGADIREMAAMTPQEGEAFGALGQQVTRLLEELPVPVVACVDGYALGGGCEMALACDFVYATGKAVFGQPEVLLGLIPGFGGCVRLYRRVGVARAREMIYSGRRADAAEAHRIGLVNQVFDTREEMFAAARLVLADIAANSPTAVATCKATINAVDGLAVGAGLRVELDAFRHTFTTDDMREGTSAFLAKRTPVFHP
ncbi:enoyl-CoA hydratase-related protein [Lentzea sp. BCCO 10_0856]|uniref:Enoyl-CoA hydratase-related protein n=1 Tax=Lentzea miocenica TaxID=3095431 RepID=A0ABU4T3I4_9PSEU|nr:enoyl-CoA hydratase-related protein [Lentzea sp. BCCO 10_0856]MDX8032711.1 enoyl-CoA hydratase-related protein [Lentzea sp. BCCO 10_0856]